MRFLRLALCILLFLFVLLPSAYALDDLKAKIEQIKSLPTYNYPIEGLPEKVKSKGVESLRLFAYGSLLSYESALRALSDRVIKTRKPSIALGVKRTFSRDVPIRKGSHWKQPYDDSARGMLNLLQTDNPYDFVNGVVIDVPVDELESLLQREQGYDLIPVVCVDWEKEANQETYVSYAFYAPLDGPYASENINPRPGYYELSRDASKDYGPGFYYAWLSSTYFADGNTPIIEWEKACQNEECMTQAR